MLLADDGSESATRARAFALAVAKAMGAALTLVYVRNPAEPPEDARRKATARLAAITRAGVDGDAVVTRPVGVTNPGRRIVTAAGEHGADLIVLGARGTGIARKLLGSVSGYVASHADVPVCIVR